MYKENFLSAGTKFHEFCVIANLSFCKLLKTLLGGVLHDSGNIVKILFVKPVLTHFAKFLSLKISRYVVLHVHCKWEFVTVHEVCNE